MKLVTIPIEQAVGGILIHNIPDAQGHKAFAKGHQVTEADIAKLLELGKTEVYVGMLEDGDVRENDAATRIAIAVAGKNVEQSAVSGGRINLMADRRGVLEINSHALTQVNSISGVTVATVPAHRPVEANKIIATIKTIGLALPESSIAEVESVAKVSGEVISIRPLGATRVGVILSSSMEARGRVEAGLMPPIRARVEELGGEIASHENIEESESTLADAITRATAAHVDCVIIAGETSIMDRDDVTPRGVERAGGTIEVYGAPVEPGNLLLLGYCGTVPILGAPGCVKSRDLNVVDLILPRLLAGERVTRGDIVELANGGLLL